MIISFLLGSVGWRKEAFLFSCYKWILSFLLSGYSWMKCEPVGGGGRARGSCLKMLTPAGEGQPQLNSRHSDGSPLLLSKPLTRLSVCLTLRSVCSYNLYASTITWAYTSRYITWLRDKEALLKQQYMHTIYTIYAYIRYIVEPEWGLLWSVHNPWKQFTSWFKFKITTSWTSFRNIGVTGKVITFEIWSWKIFFTVADFHVYTFFFAVSFQQALTSMEEGKKILSSAADLPHQQWRCQVLAGVQLNQRFMVTAV